MKRFAALATVFLLCFTALSAQEYWPDGSVMDQWFLQKPQPTKCRLQQRRFVITDYGAVQDSTVLQTEAIQKAINTAARRGGGTVVIPKGTWLSGALFFKPRTHLHLEEGAVLKGSTNTWDFPDTPVHIEGVLQPYAAALINARNCNGFTISGKGTLDGNGLPYWKAFWERRRENPGCTNLEVRRPRMIGISGSKDVSIEGIKLRNSAFWNIHLYKCARVYISDVSIYAPIKPVKAPSSDGIDLDACTDVHITGCDFATGDDLIALKGGKGPWADEDKDNGVNKRILVEYCTFGHGPGALVLGSECIGSRNVILRNSSITETDRLLWLKMRPDTPQSYSNILVDSIYGDVGSIVYIKPWTQFFDLKGRTDLPVSEASSITVQRCTLKCFRSHNIVEAPEQYLVCGLDFHGNKIRWKYNVDEDNVNPYTLEDPLVFVDGSPVSSVSQWPSRREEILSIFEREMYGTMPPACPVYLSREDEGSLSKIRMTFREDGSGPSINWMILYPEGVSGPVPAVMMLNFYGNDAVLANDDHGSATTFPLDTILMRGYAYVTACYKDFCADPDSIQNPAEQLALARKGVFELWDKDCTTGSLMAWAWGMCRGMDMLEQDERISKVVLTGCSRIGKATLIASAFDPRFDVTVINQTGGGGAPLSKRIFGEYIASEIDHFGYWWSKEYAKYADKEKDLQFDQHLLLACIAPRPLLVEGFNKPWFDTHGEFLAIQAASPVWDFLGAEGLPDVEWPPACDTSAIGPVLGYVRRDGGHGIASSDWKWMLDFADQALK